MTDANLPEQWLNSPRFDALSSDAWRVFTGALMWSNSHGTDGAIPARYLHLLHPDGEQPEAFRQMETACIWVKTSTGYQMVDWVKVLGQSTAEKVEHNKAVSRAKQQKWRGEQTKKLGKTSPSFPPASSSDVTGDVTGYVTGYVRQDKTRQKKAGIAGNSGSEESQDVGNTTSGEVPAAKTSQAKTSVTGWLTALPGSGGLPLPKAVESPKSDLTPPRTCSVCENSLVSPAALASGMCRKGDAAHLAARAAAAAKTSPIEDAL